MPRRPEDVGLTSRSPAALKRWRHHSLRKPHRAADADVSVEMTAAAHRSFATKARPPQRNTTSLDGEGALSRGFRDP
jgi:hypothetical protein